MARAFLFLNTLLFTGFGIFAFLNPAQMASMMGATDMSAAGFYELRSNYGGVSIGIGIACLFGGFRQGLARPALYLLLAYTGGYALGRILALPFDGIPPPNLIAYAIFEAVTASISGWLLLRTPQSK